MAATPSRPPVRYVVLQKSTVLPGGTKLAQTLEHGGSITIQLVAPPSIQIQDDVPTLL